AGAVPDPTTGARATPIYQTTSFVFPDTDHAAALFNMARAGHVYSRISNPTCAVLEERIAALEDGVGAIATASGQAALHLAIVTLMGAGSHIVASRALYGGSHNLLEFTLPRFGITTTFIDPRNLDEWRSAIRPETRLLFGETLGNPGLDVLDIPRVAALAHDHRLPLLVDSTFTTPWLVRPFDHGADLVFHSATKFLSGHGVLIGGLLVDSGRFAWDAVDVRGKFATLTEPYRGFHDMVFVEESTTAAFLLRARREGIRDFGACMAPFTAFQLLQGIETLPLRMAKHVDNTRKIVAFLREHPLVGAIGYPDPAFRRRRRSRGVDGGLEPRAACCREGVMRVRVRDHDVYAYTGSRLPDRTVPNVVFVHGSANDHSVFALQSRYFAYHGRNVYAVDLPGHGSSEGEPLRSVEALADWLILFLDAAEVKDASLVGHSMGSLAVLETAARHP